MRKFAIILGSAFMSLFLSTSVFAADGIPMMRLYNENTGEHFYTKNTAERNDLVVKGWNYEGVGWTAPTSGNPVYRMYNPNSGDHHYTTSQGEKNALQKKGWNYEGIGWYSDVNKAVPLYREYNPNARTGSHNYTTSQNERNVLMKNGWNYEGISWYGIKVGRGSSYEDGMYYVGSVRDITQADIYDNYLVVTGPFRFVNIWDEYSDDAEYSTYAFPITSATMFYETDSGEGDPGDATIMTAGEAAYAASHHTTGPAMEVTIRNGYVSTVRFGA